jgi:hypothetical protein
MTKPEPSQRAKDLRERLSDICLNHPAQELNREWNSAIQAALTAERADALRDAAAAVDAWDGGSFYHVTSRGLSAHIQAL